MPLQTLSVSYIVSLIFNVLYLVLLVVIILSWFPIFDMRKEPLASMQKIYDFILAPFRAVIPPIGMIDITPIFAFLALQFIERALLILLGRFGL